MKVVEEVKVTTKDWANFDSTDCAKVDSMNGCNERNYCAAKVPASHPRK